MSYTPDPVSRPVVLTIAGSDSGGGAGVQADLKTIEASGGFGTSAITSVTAQNTTGVHGSHLLPVAEIEAQIDAVLEDFAVGAVKTGMLATTPVVEAVTGYADRLPNLVVDPVMVAASGDRLLEPEAEDAYESLIAEAALVTPNADEAAVLTGIEVDDPRAAREAGDALLEMGADAALVKGGHVPGDAVVDTLVTPETVHTAEHPRVDTDATHGSGCALSSAIATGLADGEDLVTAVESGIDLLADAVRYNLDVGTGPGAVHHTVDLRDRAARQPTAETARSAAAVAADELGETRDPTVAAATPYAADAGDVAVARPDGVAFGENAPVVDALLTVRESSPDRRLACAWRPDGDAAAAFDALGWPHVTVGNGTPTPGSTAPVGGVDPERRRAFVFAPDAETLGDRLRSVAVSR